MLATAGVFARLYPLAVERGVNPVVHLEPVTPPIFRKTQKCGYVNPVGLVLMADSSRGCTS